jgi:excisionase family DNA binding protein
MSVEDLELSPKQAGQLLGYHKDSIVRLIKEKKIRADKLGHRTYKIPYREVIRFQQEHSRCYR